MRNVSNGKITKFVFSCRREHYNHICFLLWFLLRLQVPQISSSSSGGADSTFTVPDDVGMGYEGGVRVLQSLGNWTPDIPSNVPRPNLIPFTEPYVEGGSMHPASRLKALQQVQQASQGIRKTTQSKCKNLYTPIACANVIFSTEKWRCNNRLI